MMVTAGVLALMSLLAIVAFYTAVLVTKDGTKEMDIVQFITSLLYVAVGVVMALAVSVPFVFCVYLRSTELSLPEPDLILTKPNSVMCDIYSKPNQMCDIPPC